ncbi:hypothetical protein LAZ67_2004880 [Cordylochernes scorpioides]|uniref:Uncharacterized protein n=1 Tax=Cordylochernes scorpioides TaxID=51811 RepID=A0ABY6K3Y6_9ARAC|nr:hypothetical protein LAZ67_2004880 [Cordylochernes scorpioides]
MAAPGWPALSEIQGLRIWEKFRERPREEAIISRFYYPGTHKTEFKNLAFPGTGTNGNPAPLVIQPIRTLSSFLLKSGTKNRQSGVYHHRVKLAPGQHRVSPWTASNNSYTLQHGAADKSIELKQINSTVSRMEGIKPPAEFVPYSNEKKWET